MSFRVLGCRVDPIGRGEAAARVAVLANGGARAAAGANPNASGVVVTLGVEMIMEAQRNAEFRRVVNEASVVTCDSIGLLLASRLRRGPLHERVTGVELAGDLAARSSSLGDVRLYLLGGAGDTALRAGQQFQRLYPGAIVSGARDGYFRDDESDAVAAAIRSSGANVLLAGLGFPKQELWLERHLAATGCGAGIGVGGTFDVYAGNVVRAPAFFQRAGLEWAYRLLKEPSRWRRQLALPRFAVAALAEALTHRTAGNTHP